MMDITDNIKSSIFDWLANLAQMSDADIRKQFSAQNANLLNQVAVCLEDQTTSAKIIVRQENFVALTRHMRDLYVSGSRDLGNTLIEAEDLLKHGKPLEAEKRYSAFLQHCKSNFYLDIARAELAKLKK